MAEEKECCCSHKTKERSEKEYKDMIHRLNRIEGQIRGIKGMVERDAYCTDILVQVAAVNAVRIRRLVRRGLTKSPTRRRTARRHCRSLWRKSAFSTGARCLTMRVPANLRRISAT